MHTFDSQFKSPINMIISISGLAGSGKDTLGIILQDKIRQKYGMDFEIKKFAGKLKEISASLLGIDPILFEDQDFKSSDLPVWRSNEGLPMTGREFLVKLGTDAMRNHLSEDVWVNALFSDYDPLKSNWIITDTRFENELQRVRAERNSVLLAISREEVTKKALENIEKLHSSERELGLVSAHGVSAVFDMEVRNNSDIASLINTVDVCLTDVLPLPQAGMVYEHYRNGNPYSVVDTLCSIQENNKWVPAVTYMDRDGHMYVRPVQEFINKFEKV